MSSNEHDYDNEHIATACEDCLDFRLNWTATATELSTWKGVVSLLNQAAAEHFIADRNTEAGELKRLVKKFKDEQVTPLSKKLDGFIKESHGAKRSK